MVPFGTEVDTSEEGVVCKYVKSVASPSELFQLANLFQGHSSGDSATELRGPLVAVDIVSLKFHRVHGSL